MPDQRRCGVPSAAPSTIAPDLAERVLERLGFSRPPEVDPDGLAALYRAWCRRVPFDNVRKRIAVEQGDPGPLPGDAPVEFLSAWLADGTGGTCWAMHGAWTELLRACGFDARRGIATMLVAPDLPPNHGTTRVELEGSTLLVDACIQHGEPLVLDARAQTAIAHPAYGVTARPLDPRLDSTLLPSLVDVPGPRWIVRWRSPFVVGGLDCRIDSLESDAATFRTLHEATRAWSPFNFELFVRTHRDGGLLIAVRGERVVVEADGREMRERLDPERRLRFLVEEIGLRESLARRIPFDRPTPPPPGSATARARSTVSPDAAQSDSEGASTEDR